jgi:prepilin-type processing-associated H-X9-DG protein/prepilin-type N-terminal cleavage/methylation domain-containing protein
MLRRRSNGFGRPRRAFTLVELLVVIGIIALLVGILLPVLGKVRQQAATTKCATNLRALGQAWAIYCDANKGIVAPGRLPMGVFSVDREEQYRPRWYELLGAMVKRFACDNPKKIQDDSWTIRNPVFLCAAVPEWNNSRNYVFGYNYQFLGNPRPKGSAGAGDQKWVNYPVKASSVKGAQTVMALDCMGTAAGKAPHQRAAYYGDGTKDLHAYCNKGVFVDPPRLMPDSDYADHQHRSPSHRSGPDPRHGGKVNTVFCDGHVELLSLQDLGYLVKADGSIAANGPGAHNRLFSGSGTDENPPAAE